MTREGGLKLCIHERREELFDDDQHKSKVHQADRIICKTKLIKVNSLFLELSDWNMVEIMHSREKEREELFNCDYKKVDRPVCRSKLIKVKSLC